MGLILPVSPSTRGSDAPGDASPAELQGQRPLDGPLLGVSAMDEGLLSGVSPPGPVGGECPAGSPDARVSGVLASSRMDVLRSTLRRFLSSKLIGGIVSGRQESTVCQY